ncbi:MAG: hypothetical protein J7K00_00170 [Candidatus Diapherotrites archaeon]|nr:hypothetical protein [Candidatus Diapherotrites archaeon]
MVFIICPACGEDVKISDEAKEGDVIRCSSCNSKLELYKVKHEFEAEVIEERDIDTNYFQDEDDEY